MPFAYACLLTRVTRQRGWLELSFIQQWRTRYNDLLCETVQLMFPTNKRYEWKTTLLPIFPKADTPDMFTCDSTKVKDSQVTYAFSLVTAKRDWFYYQITAKMPTFWTRRHFVHKFLRISACRLVYYIVQYMNFKATTRNSFVCNLW